MENKLKIKYNQFLSAHRPLLMAGDEKILKDDIFKVSSSKCLSNLAVSIYDFNLQRHVYESPAHKIMFADESGIYNGLCVHPDDEFSMIRNGLAALRHIYFNPEVAGNICLVREYRAKVHGEYARIEESISMLEADHKGMAWLALSIANVAPNQEGPYYFHSKIMNVKTGKYFPALDDYYNVDNVLSNREKEILRLVAKGHLSKEIAAILHISTNTVNTHRQRILEKLKVDNSIEAIRYADNLGLI